jgi:hypothetical protein
MGRFSGGDGRQVYIDQQPQEALATASPKVPPATARFAVKWTPDLGPWIAEVKV